MLTNVAIKLKEGEFINVDDRWKQCKRNVINSAEQTFGYESRQEQENHG